MIEKYNIGQSSQFKSKNRYRWNIWIEEEQSVLDNIKSVTYVLHESFPDPIRTRSNPNDKFIMETSGWGTFMIYIEIERENGDVIEQEHFLILQEAYNSVIDENVTNEVVAQSLIEEKKKVFLSYSVTDQPLAERLKKLLREQNIEVTSASDAPLGGSIYDFITKSLESSDLVLEIPTEFESSSQESEISLANDYKKKVVKIPFSNDLINSSQSKELNSLTKSFIDKLF